MQFSWVGVRCPKFISKRWQRNTLKLLLYMCIVPHLMAPMTNNRRKPTNKKIWHFTLFSFMMCDIAFFGAAFSLFPFSVSRCFFRLLCFSLLFSHSSFWLSFCDYLGCEKNHFHSHPGHLKKSVVQKHFEHFTFLWGRSADKLACNSFDSWKWKPVLSREWLNRINKSFTNKYAFEWTIAKKKCLSNDSTNKIFFVMANFSPTKCGGTEKNCSKVTRNINFA